MTASAASTSTVRARNGTSWSFPYAQPYDIQLDLMQALFDAIESRKIGVFESPTGTGKSLSLICGTFTWLRDHLDKVERGEVAAEGDGGGEGNEDDDDDEPQWVKQQAAERKRKDRLRHETELKARIDVVKQKEREMRAEAARREQVFGGAFGAGSRMKKSKVDKAEHTTHSRVGNDAVGEDDDDAFLPSDLSPDAGFKSPWSSSNDESEDLNLTPAVRALMAKHASRMTNSSVNLEELPETTPKIIYACRTHSQLSQFVAELKKTPFGRDLDDNEMGSNETQTPAIRVIPLASRKQACINENVQKLGARAGNEAMNEACRELASSSGKRCSHLPPADPSGQARVLDFRDRAMSQVRDIEDLVELGREMDMCPYYASRTSAKQAQLITMPYNLLLQKNARESLGISLRNSVILIDEAHNLIDTILGVYTVSVTSTQISTAKMQINEYLRRFSTRLRGESEMHLRMLRKLLESLERALSKWSSEAAAASPAKEEVWTADRVVAEMGGNSDTIHFAALERFLKQSQIARKVSGYAEKCAKRRAAAVDDKKTPRSSASSASPLPPSAIAAMHSIESLLLSLSNKSQDGRVLLTLQRSPATIGTKADQPPPPVVHLKYQLLNPAESFMELAEQARAIVLAGGTMEPIENLRTQLMPSVSPTRLTHFSCGHIVPAANLHCSVVPTGPRGASFDFKYEKRGDPKILDDLGNALANFSAAIPHGIVVFLPSYTFLDDVVARWKQQTATTTATSAASTTSTWARLTSRKKIFLEPKDSSEVDKVLQEYSQAIEQPRQSSSTVTGALLLAVVGAKLSEGINFSDRLARAVVMVGMPFPNAKSAELVERMNYVRNVQRRQQSPSSSSSTPDAGQELYTSICMKAVNQSIGRAIRHQNDFAALLLLDQRYARADIRARLPGWIRDQVTVQRGGFGPVMKDLGAFFRDKRAKGLV